MLNIQTFTEIDGSRVEIDRREVIDAGIDQREQPGTIKILCARDGQERVVSLGIGARSEVEAWLGWTLSTLSPPSNANEITGYCHCGRCLAEMPTSESPSTWMRLAVGWTPIGLQVWCERHQCNVMHIDFEGQKHPANTTARTDA